MKVTMKLYTDAKGDIAVYLNNHRTGTIIGGGMEGYRYVPVSGTPGKCFPTVREVMATLEEP